MGIIDQIRKKGLHLFAWEKKMASNCKMTENLGQPKILNHEAQSVSKKSRRRDSILLGVIIALMDRMTNTAERMMQLAYRHAFRLFLFPCILSVPLHSVSSTGPGKADIRK